MILLGVTGSIAAYKAVEIVRLFVKAKKEVRVIMTESATHFVGPLTFQALSGHLVLTQGLDPSAYKMGHLELTETAKAIVVAPASAETLSELAAGGAGNLISATLLAVPRNRNGELRAPVFLAPAMHEAMWQHPATRKNIQALKKYGYQLIGPEKGALSRPNDVGEGRLSSPETIVRAVLKALAS